MIDRNMDRLLTETARSVVYPPTPNLGPRVEAALRLPQPARGFVLRPALVALAAAAIIVVAALAITPSRDAIARLFGVEGSKIEFLPTPLPGETATPFPTAMPSPTFQPRGSGIFPLERIAELAGFEPALPVVPDERIESSVLSYGQDAVVMHRYARFELWQSRLQGHASFGKEVRPDGTVEEVEVGGVPGTWVAGPDHIVSYTDRNGAHIPSSQRIVDTNTLIWRTEAFFYRLETDLPLEEALRIAETLP